VRARRRAIVIQVFRPQFAVENDVNSYKTNCGGFLNRLIENVGAQNALLVTVCLYLIIAPVWAPNPSARLFDGARYLELWLLGILTAQLLIPSVSELILKGWQLAGNGLQWLLGTFLTLGLFSTMVSPAPHLGTLEMALMIQCMLLFLAVLSLVHGGQANVETVLSLSIALGASLLVLKFWVTYTIYYFEGKAFSWISPFLDFANVRFFSQYQAYTLFMVCLPAATLRMGRLGRGFIYVIAANFWALQWMVGTRAVWVGCIAAILLVSLCMRKGRWEWIRSQLLVIGLGAGIFFLTGYVSTQSNDMLNVPGVQSIMSRGNASALERVALAKTAIGSMVESPFFGVGPGQFGLQDYPMNAAHPHNSPLQLLSEFGLLAGTIGIVLVALLLVTAMRDLRARSLTENDQLAATLLATLTLGITDSLFSGNLIMPHSQILFFVVSGWILGRAKMGEVAREASHSAGRLIRTTILSAGLLAIAVTAILSIEYILVIREMPPFAEGRNPHFWLFGRFSAW